MKMRRRHALKIGHMENINTLQWKQEAIRRRHGWKPRKHVNKTWHN